MNNLEQQIRERAYHLWLAEGRSNGSSDRHWFMAEREILAGRAGATAPSAVAPASKAKVSRNSRRRSRRASDASYAAASVQA